MTRVVAERVEVDGESDTHGGTHRHQNTNTQTKMVSLWELIRVEENTAEDKEEVNVETDGL